jgi:eukaryotic-like serine/threonine-protein kinase
VFKLASHIVREGPLAARDAAGWAVRLCLALEVLHRVRASHGRISARAIQVLGPSCEGGGFFLDGLDLAEDIGYHSPERLAGGDLCPEDDTWAVGVLLYYCVTGAMPFTGETPAALLGQIRKFRPAPLFRLGLNLPNLQSVIDDVLCPDPSRRIQTVVELRQRLVKCMPSTRDLSVLKLGKPELSILADDATDGDGVKLTGVANKAELDRKIQQVLEKRQSLRRAAVRAGLAEEDSEGMPTRQLRDRGAPPSDVPLSLTWDDLPESQVPSAARVASYGLELPEVGYWADEDSEIEVSYEVLDGSVAMDEGSEDTTRVRVSTPPPRERAPAEGTRATLQSAAATPPPAGRALPFAKPAPTTSDDASSAFDAPPPASWRTGAVAAICVLVGGVAAYLLLGPRTAHAPAALPPASASVTTEPTAPRPSAVAVPPIGSAASTASQRMAGASAAPASSGAPPGSGLGPGGGRPSGDVGGCLATLFPKGTFNAPAARGKPRAELVCSERDARKGARALNVLLVQNAGPGVLTDGMREWAQLGWYELALFATARTLCCQAPPALSTRTGADACALDKALERLAAEAVHGDRAALDKALDGFKETATCLLRQGGAGPYVTRGLPGRAATAVFERFLARIRPAAGH